VPETPDFKPSQQHLPFASHGAEKGSLPFPGTLSEEIISGEAQKFNWNDERLEQDSDPSLLPSSTSSLSLFQFNVGWLQLSSGVFGKFQRPLKHQAACYQIHFLLGRGFCQQ